MKTFHPKKQDIERKWYLVDAKEKTLGRLAAKIAAHLRGKHKPIFSKGIDCGDNIIVINAARIKITGNKLKQKEYFRHSGYPGGLKSINLKKLMENNPIKALETAVSGMIPRNRLKKDVLKKLRIFPGEEYKQEAQKPEQVDW